MLTIDNTQLQTFKGCPRQYQYKFILGLKKMTYDERDIDKDFGRGVHEALKTLYLAKDIGKAKEMFKQIYTGLPNEKCKTPANGLLLLDRYHNYYASPRNELSDTNLQTLEAEIKTEIPLANNITFIVKTDRFVQSNAGIWVMEHKTTTKLGNTYFYQFDPNSQISANSFACQLKYGQCSGVIVNAIVVGYRERAYKGEPAGFHCDFKREVINRNKEQLEDWKQDTLHWIARLQLTIQDGYFPKNEYNCHSFKGCPYKELCISCADDQIQSELYSIDPNPRAYLEE